jgi:hypothetical protein
MHSGVDLDGGVGDFLHTPICFVQYFGSLRGFFASVDDVLTLKTKPRVKKSRLDFFTRGLDFFAGRLEKMPFKP